MGAALVADAREKGASAVLVIGGFPCKGLFKARGSSRENLKHTDSILFFKLTRILALVRKHASGKLQVKFIVENVIMDQEPEDIISNELGCRPIKVGAGPACAAGRDRLFWVNFPVQASSHEVFTSGSKRNELTLQQNDDKYSFGDPGRGPSKDFRLSMPTNTLVCHLRTSGMSDSGS